MMRPMKMTPVTPVTDTIPPTATAYVLPTPTAGGMSWNTAAVVIGAVDNAGGSGVASITYSASGATTIAPTTVPGSSVSVPITAVGVTTVSYYATDNAANSSTPLTIAVNLSTDIIAPTANAVVAPTPNAGGWNNTNPTVAITAVDNAGGSGVASITYSASGATTVGPVLVPGSTASAVVSAEGVTTFSYYATDNAGNASAPHTVTVRLDKTAPTLIWGAQTPPPNAFGFNSGAVSIPWTASDALSGIASPGTSGVLHFTSQGANQTQSVTVVDNAGNSSTFTSPVVANIILTAPAMTASASPATATRGTGNTNVTVSGTAISNPQTALNRTSGRYAVVDSTGKKAPSGSFSIRANGTYSFTVSLSRVLANRNVPRTYTIVVLARDVSGNPGAAATTFVVR
jgi:hypothetical protein